MANGRSVQKNIKRIERFATWKLVVLLILSLFVAATFLRLNNVGMVERRQAVYDADKQGDVTVIEERLYDLQKYASAHMNADTGDVYLDKKYSRDIKDIIKKAEAEEGKKSEISSQFRTKILNICNGRFSNNYPAFAVCLREEQTKVGNQPDLDIKPIKFPSPDVYKFSFVSPAWSSDFAGWSVFVSILLVLSVILRIIVGFILRAMLRRQYKSA